MDSTKDFMNKTTEGVMEPRAEEKREAGQSGKEEGKKSRKDKAKNISSEKNMDEEEGGKKIRERKHERRHENMMSAEQSEKEGTEKTKPAKDADCKQRCSGFMRTALLLIVASMVIYSFLNILRFLIYGSRCSELIRSDQAADETISGVHMDT